MGESKYFRCIFVIFVALIASSSLATGQYFLPDDYEFESNPTVRPIGTSAPTARPVGTTVGGVRPIGTTGGPTARPIGTTARPIGTTARNIGTTARPIGTTARNIGTTARPIGTTARPIGTTGGPTVRPIGTTSSGGIDAGITMEISTPKTTPSNIISSITTKPVLQPTTQKPGGNVTVSVGPPRPTTQKPGGTVTVSVGPPKPTTPPTKPTTAIVPPVQCPLVNIMALQTGFYQVATDPCSYVSCTRTENILFCANIKCRPGTAFSPQTGRCLQSNQCAVKPK